MEDLERVSLGFGLVGGLCGVWFSSAVAFVFVAVDDVGRPYFEGSEGNALATLSRSIKSRN